MPRIVDQFGRKRCQKKRTDVEYRFWLKNFQKYFVSQEQSAVKNVFSTYIIVQRIGDTLVVLLGKSYFIRRQKCS